MDASVDATTVVQDASLPVIDGAPSVDDAATLDASPIIDALVVDASVVIDAGAFDAPQMPVDAADIDGSVQMPVDASMVDASPPTIGQVVFRDITDAQGWNFRGGRTDPDPWGIGSGAAIGDIDGDGDLDVFLARCDTQNGGPSVLLWNDGPGGELATLTSDPAMESMFTNTCAHGATLGDYDRDGDLDLFVTLNGRDRLLRNDGVNGFTNVLLFTDVSGPTGDLNAGAYFMDVNEDGLLDLYVLGHVSTGPPIPGALDGNRLYLNRGDGSFYDVSVAAGVQGQGSSQAIAFADLDDDGDMELYVANDMFAINGSGGNHELDRDQWLDLLGYDEFGVPSYQSRSVMFGMDGPRSSMGVALSDLDNDDRPEIYVSDWGANHFHVWNPVTSSYDDEAASWNLEQTEHPNSEYQISWHAEFTDINRDGREEFLLINGSVYDPLSCVSWSQFDYFLERDDMSDQFNDITASVSWPQNPVCPPMYNYPLSGRGALFADLDDDGDDDLLVTPFIEKYRFYRNDTAGQAQFLRIKPHGTVSASLPYGARLVVLRSDGVTVKRVLYAGGTLVQRYPLLEAGLDVQNSVAEATLHWPSGYSQRLDLTAGYTLNSTWRVSEPEWLSISPRAVSAADATPVLTYRPADITGAFIGAAAAGRSVTVSRSDGVATAVTDMGDGSYTAPLPHPGVARVTVVRVTDFGATLRPRLTVYYK